MIALSGPESKIVFEAVMPRLRADRRGQYRGPSTYRNGDNSSSLSVDLTRGVFFDHVTGEGGDAISFVRLAQGSDFIDACNFISDLLGRDIRGSRVAETAMPRFSDDELTRAELFRVGYSWSIERYLQKLKDLWLLDESACQPGAILNTTHLLNAVNGWSPREASEFLLRFHSSHEKFVASCIKEAQTSQMQLAEAIASAGSREMAG